jgi:hypothetical protein
MRFKFNYILVFFFLIINFQLIDSFAQTGNDTIARKDSLNNIISTGDSSNSIPVLPSLQNSLLVSGDSANQPQSLALKPHSIVVLTFVKEKVQHAPDSTYFNILKITNTNGSSINGVVKISVPLNWNLISDIETVVNISPGSTEYIPIRVSLARSVVGGVSYLINATLTSNRSIYSGKNQYSISKSCYVTIPKSSRWEIFPMLRSVYFNRYSEYSPLKLRLINRGNGTEVVKLDFEIGSSLELIGSLGNRFFSAVEIKPYCDTTLSFPVKYLPIDQSDLWNRDFKKLSVRISATVDTVVKTTIVNFKYLESSYTNIFSDRITPLTIEAQLQNLLSSTFPRLALAAYGTTLLKNEDVIDYDLRLSNIQFNAYDYPEVAKNLWRSSRISARYKSEKWEVAVGDNAGAYSSGFLGSVGRGIGGLYKLNTANTVGGSFSAAMGSPLYSGNVFHQTLLPNSVPLTYSLNTIIDNYNKINIYGASLQSSYSFFHGHTVSLLVAPSLVQHNYDDQTFTDRNGNFIVTDNPNVRRYGIASRLGYSLNREKFTVGANLLYTSRNYWQNYSGKINVSANGSYMLNNKYSLLASSGVFLDDPRRYNRGILDLKTKTLSGTHRVDFVSIMNSKLTLFVGPALDHISYSLVKVMPVTGSRTSTNFASITPKISTRCSYRNKASGIISTYAIFGYTYITSALDSTIFLPTPFFPKKKFINSRFGVNVTQHNVGVNIQYNIGPQNFSSQNDYYYFGRFGRSLRISPFFQKYYFDKKLLFSSYNSYSLEMLSNNERISLNARFQASLGREWTLFFDNNLFMSSAINSEGQKFYSRNFYMSMGVKKVFDIQQPLIKYYDLKVICFKDINGNHVVDANEKGLSDIVISVNRDVQIDSAISSKVRQFGQFY